MFKRLRSLWLVAINKAKKQRSPWNTKAGVVIDLAFIHEGVEYYQFVNGASMYTGRYAAAMDRINEIDCRVDKAYMDLFQKTLKEYLNKGNLQDAFILLHNLETRREWVTDQEFIYNLASVWFFDKNEDPASYDYEYAYQKIGRWKKDPAMLGFFLQTPIRNYLEPLPISNESILAYFKGQNVRKLQMLRYHLSKLSKEDKGSEICLTYESQIKELEELTYSN